MWKKTEGNDYYLVNENGDVLSLSRTIIRKDGSKLFIKQRILRQNTNKNGYRNVHLCYNGKVKTVLVHRLVAQAFIPNPENKPCVDHINGIRHDNRLCNLHWVTPKENCNMPLHLSKLQGENNPFYGKKQSEKCRKAVAESNHRRSGWNNSTSRPVINLDTKEIFPNARCASESLGLSDKAVRRAIERGSKCGGFRWGFYDNKEDLQ